MKLASFLAATALATAAAAASGGSVKGSKHDLSRTGPGPIKSDTEPQSCVFCHVPHRSGGGVLNGRPDIGNGHRPYESTTLSGRTGAPTGSSRICLSCHDGTIAVGQTRTRTFKMSGVGPDGRIPTTRRSNLGTDLRNTHPVSLAIQVGPKLHGPTDRHVKLDRGGDVQCTSCHDPHSEYGGSPEGYFLVRQTTGSQLCTTCHQATAGGHALSASSYTAAQGNPGGAVSIADAGCRVCHRSHGGDVTGRLLSRNPTDPDDALCLRCHGGAGAGAVAGAPVDIGRETAKPSSHAVDGGRAHDASEGPDAAAHRIPERSPSATRHAVCADCHEPHEATAVAAQPPLVQGALRGTWGIDLAGRKSDPARYEYEVCLKCHGDSANKPMLSRPGAPRRAADERNLRQVFDPSAVSFHPVAAPVRAGDVPSLLSPYHPGSLIYCTDCHASDDGAGAGGKGPRGPHGSIYAPLLERNYTTGSIGVESPLSYALCYKCHDRNVLLSDRSAFRLHKTHVMNQQTPCSVCHTAHGVSATAGNPSQNAHLVDFDLNVVGPAKGGALQYQRRGVRTGSCSLSCHGANHDNLAY